VLARFDLGIRRMKEETPVPHPRLACNHLHLSFAETISAVKKQSNSTVRSVKKKTQKDQREKKKK
jgi:hypothetical protein